MTADDRPAGAAPLERRMTLAGVLFLTLSAATPASSVFVIVPDVIHQAGTGALLAMGLAAAMALVMARVYGELGSAFPFAGGEYAIASRVLGAPAGFAMMAVNLANLILAVAVFALGLADYVRAVWPGVGALPLALAAVVAATGLGLLNVRTNAWVTGLFLLVELGALAVIAGLGFVHPERSAAEVLLNPVRPLAGALAPAGPGVVALTAAVAVFAFDGYGGAVYFAEELREPRRRLARAVTLAVVVTIATELVPLFAALTGAPGLPGFLADPSPFGRLVAERGGAALARGMSLAVALAIFNATVALLLSSARMLYATARDGVWGGPVDRPLLRIHARWRSPWVATLAAGGLGAALCFLPLRLLLVLTGTGVTAIYAGLCVALLVGRRTGATAAAASRLPLGPWLAGAALAALLASLALDATDAEEGRPSLVATVVIGAGGALAGAFAARRGRWRATAPPDDQVAG